MILSVLSIPLVENSTSLILIFCLVFALLVTNQCNNVHTNYDLATGKHDIYQTLRATDVTTTAHH